MDNLLGLNLPNAVGLTFLFAILAGGFSDPGLPSGEVWLALFIAFFLWLFVHFMCGSFVSHSHQEDGGDDNLSK
jgi:hypothetical protein